MLNVIGFWLLMIQVTIQSSSQLIIGQINEYYHLQLSYYDRQMQFSFDLRSPMYNRFETVLYYTRSKIEQARFNMRIYQGGDPQFVQTGQFLQEYQVQESDTIKSEVMNLMDLKQDGFIKVNITSDMIPHDMYSDYNLYFRLNFRIYPYIQSMNQIQYDLYGLVQSSDRQNYFYHLFAHYQNHDLFKYQLVYDLHFVDQRHQGLEITFYKLDQNYVDFNLIKAQWQKKVYKIKPKTAKDQIAFLFTDFFGYYDFKEIQKYPCLLMEVKTNKGQEISQHLTFRMSKKYIEMSYEAQQYATFIPFTIIVFVVLILSLLYFYKRNKNQGKELVKEVKQRKSRKNKLIQLVNEKKQKEKMIQNGSSLNKKYTKKVVIRKKKNKEDEDDSEDELSYDSELSENANRINQSLKKKSKKNKKTIKIKINSKSNKSKVRLISSNFIISFKKKFKIFLEKTKIKLKEFITNMRIIMKQKRKDFQEQRRTRKTKGMSCKEYCSYLTESVKVKCKQIYQRITKCCRQKKQIYKDTDLSQNQSQMHLKQQDQSSFNQKSEYNLDESAINDDKVQNIQFESNHYNSVTRSNKTNDKLDIESNKDQQKKFFFF